MNSLRQHLGRSKKLITAAAMCAGLSAGLSAPAFAYKSSNGSAAMVNTPAGKILGNKTGYGAEYLGIPYAQAPIGDLRWKAPQTLAGFDKPFQARTTGSACPQIGSPFGNPSVNEDCLFLNVYQPKHSHTARWRERLPVMVWIHGGAFTYGEGSATDPANLAEQGVIVVTLNYRIGALGFMAHPALTAEDGSSGNYGLMDQQAALQWVQDNIAAFGGNANNVTVFGESAGGLSVHALLASPGASGLFNKAIIQSGAYLLAQPALTEWEYVGLGVGANAGCTDQSAECLRELSVEEVLASQDAGALGWLPIVDGNVLPTTMLEALQTGTFNQVPVMEGTTSNEYTLFTSLSFELAGNPITSDNYQSAITELGFPPEVAPLIAAQYPPQNYPSPSEAYSALGTDFLFSCNSLNSIQLLSQFTPTYAYEFNDPNAPMDLLPPVSFPYGASHTTEIPYLMETSGPVPTAPFTAEQKVLSQQMTGYWTNFAKYGSPNGRRLPFWQRYNAEENPVNSLEPGSPQTINNFAQTHQCGFWNAILGG